MAETTLFDSSYETRKRPRLNQALDHLRPMYSSDELKVLRIDKISEEVLSLRSGRGFVNREILEIVLGNLLECVAPGSHNAPHPLHQERELPEALEEVADQLYAMITQSFLAAGVEETLEERALDITFALLWELPHFKIRAQWNRFASFKDPAVWDAYLLHNGVSREKLSELNIGVQIDRAIAVKDFQPYQDSLNRLDLAYAFDYQMQLVMSTYPGWRLLLYHDVAHALTKSGSVEGNPDLNRTPVPFLPRAMAELGGRYYQADLHPETQIGDANFLDHPHRGITTGQTGIIGSGCVIYPCTLGGMSVRAKQRHPIIGDFVRIGTDASLLGPVSVGNHSTVGPNAELHGFVEIEADCDIGSSVVIGTVRKPSVKPGMIRIGRGVRVGDGTIIENISAIDLIIPDKAEIPARSHIANDGFGHPRYLM